MTFTFTITNTGTAALADVVLTDDLDGLSEIGYTWPGEQGVLARGRAQRPPRPTC